MIGNIVFIGELFKKQMLSEKIMHEIIKGLLIKKSGNPDEDEIDILCNLLTKIGQTLDNPQAKKYMDFYFWEIFRNKIKWKKFFQVELDLW